MLFVYIRGEEIMYNERNVTPVSREELVKQGISSLSCLAGGAFFIVMMIGARVGLLGIILPLAALIIGIVALLSRDREGKKPGLIIAAAGVLGIITRFGLPVLKPFAATILTIGAVGLFVAGIIKGIKFLVGLKSRQ
jgi:hypothetical protein